MLLPRAARPRRLTATLLLLICALAATASADAGRRQLRGAPTSGSTDARWLAYGADQQLRNSVQSQGITPRSARALSVRWRAPLDGWAAASPLAASVDLASGPRAVVYVATEGGSVSAFLATSGAPLWTRSLGTVSLPGACGDWGISSTPAIDPGRGLIYAIGASGLLHALQLASGAEAPGFPLPITAARNRTEYVWGGLRIVGSELLVPVASYCDAPDAAGVPAEGGLVAVDLDAKQVAARWDPVAGGRLGGIWGYGGVSVEPGGRFLYTGVGNADVFDPACHCYRDDAGYADKLVKLAFPELTPVAANKPEDVPTDAADEDFGAAPVLFRPQGCPPLAAMNNKMGVLYLWDRGRIERGPVDRLALNDGAVEFVGAPAWSSRLRMLFESDVITWGKGGVKSGYGLSALRVGGDCRLHEVWRQRTGDGNQPPPIVVGDVVFSSAGSGGFAAFDARSGRPLWRFETPGALATAPPIEAGGSFYAVAGTTLYAFTP